MQILCIIIIAIGTILVISAKVQQHRIAADFAKQMAEAEIAMIHHQFNTFNQTQDNLKRMQDEQNRLFQEEVNRHMEEVNRQQIQTMQTFIDQNNMNNFNNGF